MMEERITLSGMGGQGIILLGTLIASCAMEENKHVTLIPSYGAEMRGGLSQSFVTISEAPIGSPVFSYPDSAILMYQPSVDKYQATVKKNGLIIYNENMVQKRPDRNDLEVIGVPANSKAQELGSLKSANIILLGAWCRKKDLFPYPIVVHAIRNIFKNKKSKVVELNLLAFDLGFNYHK